MSVSQPFTLPAIVALLVLLTPTFSSAGPKRAMGFFEAIRIGRTEVVRRYLDAGTDVDAARTDGITPLLLAAQYGRNDIVELLLKRGADPNLAALPSGPSSRSKWSPLMVTPSGCKFETATLLLEYGADPNFEDKMGLSPKSSAALYQCGEMISLLSSPKSKKELRRLRFRFRKMQRNLKERYCPTSSKLGAVISNGPLLDSAAVTPLKDYQLPQQISQQFNGSTQGFDYKSTLLIATKAWKIDVAGGKRNLTVVSAASDSKGKLKGHVAFERCDVLFILDSDFPPAKAAPVFQYCMPSYSEPFREWRGADREPFAYEDLDGDSDPELVLKVHQEISWQLDVYGVHAGKWERRLRGCGGGD